MSDIVWGRDIPVDGKRPDWLRDNDQLMYHDKFTDNWHGYTLCWRVHELNGEWFVPDLIRLRAHSPVYAALEAGFVPWAGGDSAPLDWDEGIALMRDGTHWKHEVIWWSHDGGKQSGNPSDADIIGYKRKAETAANQWEALEKDVAGDWVRVKRITQTELFSLPDGKGDPVDGKYAAGYRDAYRNLALVLPPTRAEVISQTTGVSVADVEKVLAEIVS